MANSKEDLSNFDKSEIYVEDSSIFPVIDHKQNKARILLVDYAPMPEISHLHMTETNWLTNNTHYHRNESNL